jgi:8-oxo-dGTP diphosphatase
MGRSDQGVEASAGRYTVLPRVLVFVFNGDDVLLLKGAPHKRIWANRYNGVGGHVEADEDVYAAARREVREETGLHVRDLHLRGVVHVDVASLTGGATGTAGIVFFVFTARSEERQVHPGADRPSAEGTLEWTPRDRLTRRDMVEDLPILLDRIAGMSDGAPPFFARYSYDDRDRLRIAFAEPI